MLCISKDIDLKVIYKDKMFQADRFVKDKIAEFGEIEHIDTRKTFSLYGYHNTHNEYVTDIRNKENLLIVLGDSWAVGDNHDTSDYWHVGQMEQGFAHLVAQELDADLVACASPGNSNQLAIINFAIWYLHNKHLVDQYRIVNVLFSTTSAERDFAVHGNLGSWSEQRESCTFVIEQTTEKLLTESTQAIDTFVSFCKWLNMPFKFVLNHGTSVHRYLRERYLDFLIGPKNEGKYSYGQLFKRTDLVASCGHPSDKGNQFLANEICRELKRN
jgi:hypothetical protein